MAMTEQAQQNVYANWRFQIQRAKDDIATLRSGAIPESYGGPLHGRLPPGGVGPAIAANENIISALTTKLERAKQSTGGNPVLDTLKLDPKLLLYGAAGLAGAGVLVGGGILAAKGLGNSSSSKRGRKHVKGRAYEKGRGITGTRKQYARSGGGDVKYTKKGQPYVIAADGKARFIKR